MRVRGDIRSLLQAYRRVAYYAGNFMRYYIPGFIYRPYLKLVFSTISEKKKAEVEKRVDYYVRLGDNTPLGDNTVAVKDFRYPFHKKKKYATYFFDLFPAIRCFPRQLRFSYLFGDVNWNIAEPTLVKSRPVVLGGKTSGNVLCRLNSVRHYRFIRDSKTWEQKKDMLVFRNVVREQPHRTLFVESFVDDELCDVGQINESSDKPRLQKPYMPMNRMLDYKFIACIEGNDVATNLKWVMSSNSVAVMPRPKIESWFMESTLIPNFHYIEIKDDYSDLDDKIRYYIDHPAEAKAIVRNANEYVKSFKNRKLEKYIQYRVLRRYFEKTRQL